MKTILNFEVITPTPLVFAFPAILSDFNLKDDSLYHSTGFKRLEVPFLRKLKNKQKTNWFMTEEEKLHALQVLDELLCYDGEEFDENDSQL